MTVVDRSGSGSRRSSPCRRRWVLAAAALAGVMVLAGCGTPSRASRADPGLTATAATTPLVQLMQATADLLPAGVVLSTQNPVAGSEPFGAQGVGPCGRPDEGLQTVALDRWVLGLHGPDGELSAVATLTASWAAHGWVVTRSPPTGGQLNQQASAVPYPDAVITVQRNDHGDVSVGVGSPCFPQSSPKAALTAPAVFSSQRS